MFRIFKTLNINPLIQFNSDIKIEYKNLLTAVKTAANKQIV